MEMHRFDLKQIIKKWSLIQPSAFHIRIIFDEGSLTLKFEQILISNCLQNMPQTDSSSNAPIDASMFCYRHLNSRQFAIMSRLMYAHKYVSMNTNFKFNAIVGHMRLDSRRMHHISTQLLSINHMTSGLVSHHTYILFCMQSNQTIKFIWIYPYSIKMRVFSIFCYLNSIITSGFDGIQTENCQKIEHFNHTDHTHSEVDINKKS